ncbi:MAG TPA: FAD-dependent oxidoreductase [Caldilineaceae bacterium]|nr:FAD-dependent oxidoreductase [Caldilineaceae bacterium]
MVKPTILVLDDEPQVLGAIERDLRRHYRGEYRLVKSTSGTEALDAVRTLKQRNEPVALFLVDQRMPTLSGTEFLLEAIKLYPEARKVLLTAYADTDAAITSINQIGLDYYLVKPWDPPELRLYPILDDLLYEWKTTVDLPYEGIRVAGTLWSARSHDVKDFLARNRIPYQWLDIEKDPEARTLTEAVNQGQYRLPVVFMPDGEVLVEPDYRTLAVKCGLQTQASQPFYDLIIVGAGPAGLGAAVYGASEGLRTLMIEREATGGQAGTSSRIENYLGFHTGISGSLLAERATIQARRLGAEILTAQEVSRVRVEDPYRIAVLGDGSEVACHALLIATGVTVRRLDAPGVEQLTGAGIYYGAAISEAMHYQDEHVFIVGGANSAGQAAMYFSRYASQVTMVVRGSGLAASMSQYLIDQIMETPNIEVLSHCSVVEAHGDHRLEALTICNSQTNQTWTAKTPACFIFIGAVPHTEMVAGLVARNQAGFILTGMDLMTEGQRPKSWPLKRDPFLLETSVPGIFAAGDVRHGAIRRVASAVGEGAICVSLVHQYLKTV